MKRRGQHAPGVPPLDQLVLDSGWFDPRWYLDHHPDLVAVGVTDATDHYLRWGAAEGRSPGPGFDAAAYRLLNPASAANPLLHYLTSPTAKGLRPDEVIDPLHPAIAGGWFDPDWYRLRYAAAMRTDVHPYVDYVWHGVPQRRDPSPLFDLGDYIAGHPGEDLGADPVLHFLAHRDNKPWPRCVRWWGPHRDRGELVQPIHRPVQHLAERTCVVLHAHYADVVPELLVALRSLPPGFTLLVAVPSADRVDDTERLVDHFLGAGTRRVVKVAANRGRNFGPMLCELAPDIREHELMLHLHTKKSQHTGSERVGWRRHLLRALAGSPAVVSATLSLFDELPDVGVVHPSMYPELPYWATHWLGNAANGKRLFERMGLEAQAVHGYGDYPVGGMFWARVEALRPLLDLGLTADDFEPEPAHHDGLLAHAIERSINAVARSRGFHAVELDYDLAQWRLDWSTRNSPTLGPTPVAALENALERARLVTVDLFDTIVLRPSLNPASLQHVAARGVTTDPAAAAGLVARRVAAEVAARRAHPDAGDVTMAQIYAELAGADGDLAPRLAAREVAIEQPFAVPRTSLIDALRRAKERGARLVLMTDTFLPRRVIDDLLAHVGAGDLFDDAYVSNEAMARKDTGAMWSLVAANEGVGTRLRLDEWLHIGDNEFSDVQAAAVRGVPVVHIASAAAAAQFDGLDTSLLVADERPGTDVVVGSSLVHLLTGEPHRWWAEASPLTRLGYCGLGPLVLTFVSWLTRVVPAANCDHMLFVARDGHLLQRAVSRLRPFLRADVPPGHYFLCSRRVALSVAQHERIEPALVLDAGEFSGTIGDLLHARLGIRIDDPRAACVVSLPHDSDLCAAVLHDHAQQVQAHARRERDGLLHHLRDLGVAAGDRVALIDLGYSATAQRALGRALPNDLTGFYWATTPQAHDGTAGHVHACFGSELAVGPYHGVMHHRLLLEALLAADHGQVEALVSNHAGLSVRLGASRRTPAEQAQVHEVQAAALQFCIDVVERAGPEILDEPIDAQLAMAPWARILSPACDWAAGLFRSFRLDNEFTGLGSSPVR